MALVNADRVKESTTTTGTGTLTLAGAVTGFQSFSAIGNANTCYCCCYAVNAAGNPTGEWELFLGTYTASGTTLARTTLIASSTGSAINFSAGTKHVVVCLPSQGTLVVRKPGGTVGSQELQISHDGTNVTYTNPAGSGSTSCHTFNGYISVANKINCQSINPIASGYGGEVGGGNSVLTFLNTYITSTAWIQNTKGLSRVDTAVTNSTTTLANVTGLSATLLAGRKYTGKLVLFASDATAADGLKLDFDGGTATMTSFQAAVTGNTQGATAGTTVSAAIATDLNFTALNGTGVNCIEVQIAFVCNAAGTFIPRIAKDSDAGGATLTIAANSFMELQDAP